MIVGEDHVITTIMITMMTVKIIKEKEEITMMITAEKNLAILMPLVKTTISGVFHHVIKAIALTLKYHHAT